MRQAQLKLDAVSQEPTPNLITKEKHVERREMDDATSGVTIQSEIGEKSCPEFLGRLAQLAKYKAAVSSVRRETEALGVTVHQVSTNQAKQLLESHAAAKRVEPVDESHVDVARKIMEVFDYL